MLRALCLNSMTVVIQLYYNCVTDVLYTGQGYTAHMATGELGSACLVSCVTVVLRLCYRCTTLVLQMWYIQDNGNEWAWRRMCHMIGALVWRSTVVRNVYNTSIVLEWKKFITKWDVTFQNYSWKLRRTHMRGKWIKRDDEPHAKDTSLVL